MLRFAPIALAALALAACSGEAPADPTPAPTPVPVAEPAPAPDTSGRAIVPSPSETQLALKAAGIETTLASLIDHPALSMTGESEDQIAVSTGVIVADMILTATTSTKEQLTGQLSTIQIGMKQLDGGSDIDQVLEDLKKRAADDSMTRDELVSELELLSSAIIPELEFNGRARIVPLIQAGSWLEASNLLSRAIIAVERPEAADAMLKQPEVVAYFHRYVTDHGVDTPAQITTTLTSSLETLAAISAKTEPLTLADVEAVKSATQDVLALL